MTCRTWICKYYQLSYSNTHGYLQGLFLNCNLNKKFIRQKCSGAEYLAKFINVNVSRTNFDFTTNLNFKEFIIFIPIYLRLIHPVINTINYSSRTCLCFHIRPWSPHLNTVCQGPIVPWSHHLTRHLSPVFPRLYPRVSSFSHLAHWENKHG